MPYLLLDLSQSSSMRASSAVFILNAGILLKETYRSYLYCSPQLSSKLPSLTIAAALASLVSSPCSRMDFDSGMAVDSHCLLRSSFYRNAHENA